MQELDFNRKLATVSTELSQVESTTTGIQASMQKLENLIFAHRDLFLNGSADATEALMQRTRPQYSTREVRLEDAIRREIIEGNLDPQEALQHFAKYPSIQRTFNYSTLEAEAMKLKEDSTFVHVGCGSLPETLIGIHRVTKGSHLSGVDMDSEAISKGKSLLATLNLKHINLIQANGSEFDYSNTSDVLVAVLVRPEVETVARICETASKDMPITVALRRAFGVAQAIYEDISPQSLQLLQQNGFRQVNRVKGHAVVQTDIFRRN